MKLQTNEFLDLLLALDQTGSSSVASGPLNACTIGLYQTDLALDRTTPLATFLANECAYSGYARQLITWLAPSRGDDGLIEVIGTASEFRPTDALNPESSYGIFCVLAGSGSLGFCGRFDDAPKPMGDTHDHILVQLAWKPITGGLVADAA